MNIHMLAIIPLMVGLILLVIGLVFKEWIIDIVAAVWLAYGLIIHSNNIRRARRNFNRYEAIYSTKYYS